MQIAVKTDTREKADDDEPSSSPVTLALDIGGTGLKASLLDEQGDMVTEKLHIPTPHPCPPDRVSAIARRIDRAAAEVRPRVGRFSRRRAQRPDSHRSESRARRLGRLRVGQRLERAIGQAGESEKRRRLARPGGDSWRRRRDGHHARHWRRFVAVRRRLDRPASGVCPYSVSQRRDLRRTAWQRSPASRRQETLEPPACSGRSKCCGR